MLKTTPFEFTDIDGATHQLEVSEFSISDSNKLIELQKPLIESGNKMDVIEQSNLIIASRIICSVKIAGMQSYFWRTIDDFTKKAYPSNLINVLYPLVGELNPTSTETLDEKKS